MTVGVRGGRGTTTQVTSALWPATAYGLALLACQRSGIASLLLLTVPVRTYTIQGACIHIHSYVYVFIDET